MKGEKNIGGWINPDWHYVPILDLVDQRNKQNEFNRKLENFKMDMEFINKLFEIYGRKKYRGRNS